MAKSIRPTWYRVVGSGGGGAPARTQDEAWASALRGVDADEQGTFGAAHCLRLVAATTRRAAMHADISEGSGQIGRGEWWLTPE